MMVFDKYGVILDIYVNFIILLNFQGGITWDFWVIDN